MHHHNTIHLLTPPHAHLTVHREKHSRLITHNMATNGAHANGTLFTPSKYPPFPKDVPSVKLETFSLAQLEKGDKALEDKLFETCKERGFFYLDLNGSKVDSMGQDCDDIARLAEKVFKLPAEVKEQYAVKDNIFG